MTGAHMCLEQEQDSKQPPLKQIILDTFKQLSNEKVFCCSWKNNHLILASIAGQRDIDIYVRKSDRRKFEAIMRKLGYFELAFTYAFPYVSHFYFASVNGLIHFHVYYQFVTGASHTKEFLLPVEEKFPCISTQLTESIPMIGFQEAKYLFLLRHFIKVTSLTGFIFYFRERDCFKKEWKAIDQPEQAGEYFPNFSDDSEISVNHEIANLEAVYNRGGFVRSLVTGVKLRRMLSSYRRASWVQQAFGSFVALIRQVWRKLFGVKKLTVNGGVSIAIIGSDGSGKSSICNAINELYSPQLSTEILGYGIPNATIIDRIIMRFIEQRSIREAKQDNAHEVRQGKQTPLIRALFLCFLAYRRRNICIRGNRRAALGKLIIFDRYSHTSQIEIDGARIRGVNSMLVSWLSKLERYFYSQIPYCDHAFILKVSQSVAVERNEQRIKKGKESKEAILFRHKCIEGMTPKAKEKTVILNDGALQDSLAQILTRISQYL